MLCVLPLPADDARPRRRPAEEIRESPAARGGFPPFPAHNEVFGGLEEDLSTDMGFCARAVWCSCPWGSRARYPSVPAPCPYPLPFGARPMPAPFCGRYSFATRSRCVLLLTKLLSFLGVLLLLPWYSPATPTRFVLLPVRCPRPPDARSCPLPVPAACPCPYSSVCSFARSSPCASQRDLTWRANMSARTAHAATFQERKSY